MVSNLPLNPLGGNRIYICTGGSDVNLKKIILKTASYDDIKAGLIIANRREKANKGRRWGVLQIY